MDFFTAHKDTEKYFIYRSLPQDHAELFCDVLCFFLATHFLSDLISSCTAKATFLLKTSTKTCQGWFLPSKWSLSRLTSNAVQKIFNLFSTFGKDLSSKLFLSFYRFFHNKKEIKMKIISKFFLLNVANYAVNKIESTKM